MTDTADISIGDYVRSFDFDHSRDTSGDNAYFVEGEVIDIARHPHAPHQCYCIRVDRRVYAGDESPDEIGEVVYTPVNGLLNMLRDTLTNGVSKIARPIPANRPLHHV